MYLKWETKKVNFGPSGLRATSGLAEQLWETTIVQLGPSLSPRPRAGFGPKRNTKITFKPRHFQATKKLSMYT